MLAIRLQRTGRKGHAQFRLIVQESRLTPTSGRVVASLGNYNPHSKAVTVDKEKAAFYLEHGAQPSPRVAVLLKNEGVKLPKWVVLADKKQSAIKNPDKLRRNQPAEPAAPAEAPADDAVADAPAEAAESPAVDAAPEAAEAEAPTEDATDAATDEAAADSAEA
jgi:small subunit ribosomal protein S16